LVYEDRGKKRQPKLGIAHSSPDHKDIEGESSDPLLLMPSTPGKRRKRERRRGGTSPDLPMGNACHHDQNGIKPILNRSGAQVKREW